MMSKLSREIVDLPSIAEEAAEEYYKKRIKMKEFVDEKMAEKDNIDKMIGNNSREVMFANHKNHANFMSNVFEFNELRLLIDTLPWVYYTYKNKGFSYEYFYRELYCWIDAVKKYLSEEYRKDIIEIYEWMLENHEEFIELTGNCSNYPLDIEDEWRSVLNEFLDALFIREIKDCKNIAETSVTSRVDFRKFARNVIKPALYTVGCMWEQGDITVGEEHRITTIATRILSFLQMNFLPDEYTRGKAVVSTVENEYHEIGARIIADFLEFDGWQVSFLGANTPRNKLIKYLEKEQPFILGLSVSLPNNLRDLNQTIKEVRAKSNVTNTKILIGGKALNDFPYLQEKFSADAFAENGEEAVKIANKWWEG